MRRIVLAFGALVALIGLSQVAAAHWWTRVLPSLMGLGHLRAYGIIILAIGIVLLMAALLRAVKLRLFVLILGLWILLAGAALLLIPAMMRDTAYAFFLNRAHGTQMTMMIVSGLVRVVIGILLVYAAGCGPRAASRDTAA